MGFRSLEISYLHSRQDSQFLKLCDLCAPQAIAGRNLAKAVMAEWEMVMKEQRGWLVSVKRVAK